MDLLKLNNKGLSKLLDILCCPECHGALIIDENGLICSDCKTSYPCRDNILKLCADNKDEYIKNEEALFERSLKNPKNTFPELQAEASKKHYIETVYKTFDDFTDKVVIHVGCGVDIFVGHFEDSLFYFSADITEGMLRAIDTKGKKNKILVQCSAEKLPFKTQSIDVVLCVDMIHHFYSRGIAFPLMEIVRCLAPEGTFFLEEPNRYSLYRLHYCLFPLKILNILRMIKRVFNRLMKKQRPSPVSYEAPLSISQVMAILRNGTKEMGRGNINIDVVPALEYLSISKLRYDIFRFMGAIAPVIFKYFGYHWFIIMKNNRSNGELDD